MQYGTDHKVLVAYNLLLSEQSGIAHTDNTHGWRSFLDGEIDATKA